MKNGTHNHGPSPNLSAHAGACRVTEEVSEEIAALTQVGLTPTFILATIKDKFPSTRVKLQGIYNKRSRIMRKSLDGRTPAQALLEVLQGKGVKHMV